MSKIIRKPDFAGGGITDEEKAAMDRHAEMWIERIMRTEPIEPDKIVPAIRSLYKAADLKEPRVVIVPSPFVMAMAGGFASAIWYARKSSDDTWSIKDATDTATRGATWAATDAATDAATYDATRGATDAATDAATSAATRVATDAATWTATYDATDTATRDATRGATWAATYAATRAATDAATRYATMDATEAATWTATYDATYDATMDATEAATRVSSNTRATNLVKLMLSCASNWANMYQGGNMWGQWDSYITAARDILGLKLPEHEKYAAWEQCAIHGGFRIMHDEFCMVSDFPVYIKTDERNLPHCEDGPSHLWRDGYAISHWHGVHIPNEWVMGKPPTAAEAITWENMEQRRAACEIVGWVNILEELNAETIDKHDNPMVGELVAVDIPDIGREQFLRVKCGTNRLFALPVPPDMDTAENAQRWLNFIPDDVPFMPDFRT